MESIYGKNLQKDVHNYGIDLLKIVSMIMIPILHILGHGGILSNSKAFSAHYEIAWLLEIAAYCAVDSYALISGYVGYGKEQKYSNILYLFFQVIFYTIPITAVFLVYKPELVGVKTIIKAAFPFAYNTYWYFTAYFCLFFFTPYLNKLLDKFEKKEMQKLLLTLCVIFSLLPTLFYSDFGATNGGYSFLWLAILYLVGAYIKKYGIPFSYQNWGNLLGYLMCVILTWLSKACIELLTIRIFGAPKGGNYLISYTSPTIIFCSLFLLLFFANLNCGKALIKFARLFAPVSFGVYLFHEEPLIRDTFISGAFVDYLSLDPLLMALAVIGTALCIWLMGSFIDKIRLVIFNILRVKQFCALLENKIRGIFMTAQKRLSVLH